MKKIMIATAIVCAVAISQAASIKWSDKAATGSAGSLFGPDKTTEITVWGSQSGYSLGDVILMNTADYSQSDFLTDLRSGELTFGDQSLGMGTVNNKGIAQTTTTVADSLKGSSIDVYYAIFATAKDGTESVLISTLKSDIAIPSDDGSATVAWSKAGHTFSANNFGDANFSDAGWYTVSTEETPEPTSGLLLLLGMAGLALRRKQA